MRICLNGMIRNSQECFKKSHPETNWYKYSLSELAHNIGIVKKIVDEGNPNEVSKILDEFFELYLVEPKENIPFQKWLDLEDKKRDERRKKRE